MWVKNMEKELKIGVMVIDMKVIIIIIIKLI